MSAREDSIIGTGKQIKIYTGHFIKLYAIFSIATSGLGCLRTQVVEEFKSKWISDTFSVSGEAGCSRSMAPGAPWLREGKRHHGQKAVKKKRGIVFPVYAKFNIFFFLSVVPCSLCRWRTNALAGKGKWCSQHFFGICSCKCKWVSYCSSYWSSWGAQHGHFLL